MNNDKFNDILTSNIKIETNLYIMFKVKKGENMATNWCIPKEQFRSFRGKQVILKFDPPQDETNCESCCNKKSLDFKVYVDLEDMAPNVQILNRKLTNSVVDWYLGKNHVSGFKNYKYMGIPISDTWLNPNIIDRVIL